jgi:hypothetical protein
MIRTRQPQGAVRFDPSALGFVPEVIALPTYGVVNLGSSGPHSSADAPISPRRNGLAYAFDGVANRKIATSLPVPAQGSNKAFYLVSFTPNAVPETGSYSNVVNASKFQLSWGHTNASFRNALVFYDNSGTYRSVNLLTTAAGVPTVACATFDPDGQTVWLYQDGALCGSVTGAANFGDAGNGTNWEIGFLTSVSSTFNGSINLAVISSTRCITKDKAQQLSRNPWQLFAPSRRVWVQLGAAAGGGAVTGTASITQSPHTLTGAVTVAVSGTLNKTPAAQTATTAAAVAIAGTLNKTQAAQTVTTAGSVAVSGTFNKTPAAQTLTASGTVASGVTGTASITPTAQTVTGSGAVPIAATATVTPSAQTATTSGAVQVAATATITPAAQTLTATGTVVSGVVGNATITPAAQTATASGTVPIAATATVTPAPQTLSSTAAVSGGAVTGTANIYVSAQTLVAAANIIVLGTATITPAPQTLLGLEAGTLPADIPASSRTLSQMTERLGSEWVATDPARLGLATARRSRPRLG